MGAVFIPFSDLFFNESIQSRVDDLASRLAERVFIRSVKFAVVNVDYPDGFLWVSVAGSGVTAVVLVAHARRRRQSRAAL